jgi:hypothetical protein
MVPTFSLAHPVHPSRLFQGGHVGPTLLHPDRCVKPSSTSPGWEYVSLHSGLLGIPAPRWTCASLGCVGKGPVGVAARGFSDVGMRAVEETIGTSVWELDRLDESMDEIKSGGRGGRV